ncbi:hypothetical protein QTP70_029126, partial [Hemibagrus guttatus]
MEDNNSDVLVRDRGCLRSDIENTSTRSTVGARTCRMMESPTITASCHSGGEVLTRGLASVFRCCCNCTQAPWYLSPGVNGTWTGHILGALGLERETRGIELVEVLVSYRKFTWDSHGGKDDLCHTLSPHNADFAFSLYNKLSNKADAKGKNIFFSPLSISMALSMLALGAKGETKSQIFSTLGYSSLTEDHVNEAYEHLLHMLDHSQEAMLLETGGGLAVREGFKPVDKFLKNLQHFYQAEAFTVDFSKSDVAVQEINKFIAKKTKDTITDMVKSLDTDTIMVLINYIYFRDKWEKPFELCGSVLAQVLHLCLLHYHLDNLRELGIVDAFSDNADLSRMSEETKLKASMVLHQAVLTVNEKGTKASAATAIRLVPWSLLFTIYLNRPFLVFIVEKSTKCKKASWARSATLLRNN